MDYQRTLVKNARLLEVLSHYLPSQSPLKDFIHHNTLHAYESLSFFEALSTVRLNFGYKSSLSPKEYLGLYQEGAIDPSVLEQVIKQLKGSDQVSHWMDILLHSDQYSMLTTPLLGQLRSLFKQRYHFDLEGMVTSTLFRIVNSYLDQGVAIWKFPLDGSQSFLEAVRLLDKDATLFRSERVQSLFHSPAATIEDCLSLLVGDIKYFEHYLFDQQFSHPGWSGMISVLEHKPNTLVQQRPIRLEEFVFLECLLEIEYLDNNVGQWESVAHGLHFPPFDPHHVPSRELVDEIIELWQCAYEWTYYYSVLSGLRVNRARQGAVDYQAFFCMDDRECSFRRNLEMVSPTVETYGTPGHFNLEIYFQPEKAVLRTKSCPAPVTPKFLIREHSQGHRIRNDFHYSKRTHGLFQGWLYTHTIGFWSGLKLALNVFHPTENASSVSAYQHMNPDALLTAFYAEDQSIEDDLQVGLKFSEAADRIASMLRSTGCIDHFSQLIYIIGHGSSSANNTHYAGYNCGACSGRPGSVNARVFSLLANHEEVRKILADVHGIVIPSTTRFIGALHDTSRDDIFFYDLEELDTALAQQHRTYALDFNRALDLNAKERSRRFATIDSNRSASAVHQDVRKRTVSLFEPRPELNHSNNTLCVIGSRKLTRGLFLDRRSFLNSYDWKLDRDGTILGGILAAANGVIGGINLEYFFSRVDQVNFGAGTKLPHNVMGLIGVANGVDGDLRTGLPSQMIEVHDPMRMMVVVEQELFIVQQLMQAQPILFQLYCKGWMHLFVKDPVRKSFYVLDGTQFREVENLFPVIEEQLDMESYLSSSMHNLPIVTFKTHTV